MADAAEALGRFLEESKTHLREAFWDRPDMLKAIDGAELVTASGRNGKIPHMLKFTHPSGRGFRLGFRQNLLTNERSSKVFALELPDITLEADTPHLPPWTRGVATRKGETFPFLQVEWIDAKGNDDRFKRLNGPPMQPWLLGLGVDLFRFAWWFLGHQA